MPCIQHRYSPYGFVCLDCGYRVPTMRELRPHPYAELARRIIATLPPGPAFMWHYSVEHGVEVWHDGPDGEIVLDYQERCSLGD